MVTLCGSLSKLVRRRSFSETEIRSQRKFNILPSFAGASTGKFLLYLLCTLSLYFFDFNNEQFPLLLHNTPSLLTWINWFQWGGECFPDTHLNDFTFVFRTGPALILILILILILMKKHCLSSSLDHRLLVGSPRATSTRHSFPTRPAKYECVPAPDLGEIWSGTKGYTGKGALCSQ